MALFDFLRKKRSAAAEGYEGMRQMILNLDPHSLANTLDIPDPVRGMIIDLGQSKGTATLVVLADSTVSLYFSNGGGAIGLGGRPESKEPTKDLLTSAVDYLPQTQPESSPALPQSEHTRFHFLTLNGMFYYEALEMDLGNNRLIFSPLFHQAQKLITIALVASSPT